MLEPWATLSHTHASHGRPDSGARGDLAKPCGGPCARSHRARQPTPRRKIQASGWLALIATTALLTIYSFLAGRRGGLGLGGSLLSACIGTLLGPLVIALKASCTDIVCDSAGASPQRAG